MSKTDWIPARPRCRPSRSRNSLAILKLYIHMLQCMHACLQTYIHPYIQSTYTHAYTHAFMDAWMHACIADYYTRGPHGIYPLPACHTDRRQQVATPNRVARLVCRSSSRSVLVAFVMACARVLDMPVVLFEMCIPVNTRTWLVRSLFITLTGRFGVVGIKSTRQGCNTEPARDLCCGKHAVA